MLTIVLVLFLLSVITFVLFLLFLSSPLRKKEIYKRKELLLDENSKKVFITGIMIIFLVFILTVVYVVNGGKEQNKSIKDSSSSSSQVKSKSSEKKATQSTSTSSTSTSSSISSNSSLASESSSASASSVSETAQSDQNEANGIAINNYFESDDNGKAVVSGSAPSSAKKLFVKSSIDDSSMSIPVGSDGKFSFDYQLQSADSEVTLYFIVESDKDKIPYDKWVETDVIPSTNYERKLEDASKEKEEQELDAYNKQQQEKLVDSVDTIGD